MPTTSLPRQALAYLPTPLIELPRLSRKLGGPRLLMKRDDQTGLALGGNKTRKLEFLMAEALALGCDCVITAGAAQSNHCRQTAAAAAMLGLPCHLVLGGSAPEVPSGNVLLDLLFGATIHWAGELRKGEQIPAIEAELRAQGRRPYLIPYGGSNVLGAAAFDAALAELAPQLEALGVEIDAIVFASSSGGTHAGLMVGQRHLARPAQVIGIGIDKGEAGELPFDRHIAELASATAERLGLPERYTEADVTLQGEYLGGGYGIVGALEREAIGLLARTEGILLDPVYTGRAFGGLLDLVRRGTFLADQTVLFWHTGGTPALFSYAEMLLDKQ